MIKLHFRKKFVSFDREFSFDINENIEKNKISVLFGKSGAGKSTILNIIAGLIKPDFGEIIVGNEVWFDSSKKINLSPQKRKVGFVFQDYALFPNMSVEKNLTYALVDKKDKNKIDEILELVDLKNLRKTKPAHLSGGQKQRVALGRALVSDPKILLLDEPLSALDFSMRASLQDELLKIQKHFGITTLLVSHDISEVYKLGDFIYEIQEGKVNRKGTPSELFGGERVSGKFKFHGVVVNIAKNDILYIVSTLVDNEVVEVVATKKEISDLKIGSRVTLTSKAFNPLIFQD